MLDLLRKTVLNNAKFAAGGAAALLLAGAGTATTVSLSDSSTPAPSSHPSATSDNGKSADSQGQDDTAKNSTQML